MHPVIDHKSGAAMTYTQLHKGPNGSEWEDSVWLTNLAASRNETVPKCQLAPTLFSVSGTKTFQPTKHQLIVMSCVNKNR
jgi:hypothetical protein